MNYLISLLITLFLTVSPALAKAPLWKVSKGDDHLFIGGTIHVLGSDDYPLPASFEKIYKESEQLVLETDIQKLQSPEMQIKMLQLMSYQDDSTLKDHLKPETYKALETSLSKNGIPIFAVQKFKPGMVGMMLTVIELKKLGISIEGVDQFYSSKALKDKKTLGKLETIEEQLTFLTDIGKKDPDSFIMYTLRDMTEFPEMFQALKKAWREGNMNKMAELAIEPMKKDYPATYKTILVQRNNAWIPQIEALLKTKEVEMVLVGTLHLAGEEGVLKQLQKRGYTIEQY